MVQDRETLSLVAEAQAPEQKPWVAVGQAREPVAQYLSAMLGRPLALVDCQKPVDSPVLVSPLLPQQ